MKNTPDWKKQTYVLGALSGAFVGLLASYLFAKAVEEDDGNPDNERPPIQTAQLIGLALAAIGLIRQISEMGKTPKKKD